MAITSSPLSAQALRRAHAQRSEFFLTTQFCPERPYVEIQVPEEIQAVQRIIFRTRSRDQGFSHEEDRYRGTYENSYSWFEVAVVASSGRERLPRRHLQNNAHAVQEYKDHETCWDVGNEDNSLREWLDAIHTGDRVQIIPRAQHQAWRNFVEKAEIEVYGLSKTDESVPPQEIPSDDKIYYSLTQPNAIRYIILQPGIVGTGVVCHLQYAGPYDDPAQPYECLSYCWGDRRRFKDITFVSFPPRPNGSALITTKTVTSNLHDALISLRYPSRPRILWIDALCINQDDPYECSAQVGMMRGIFASAERVVIWLGRGTTATTGSMDTAQRIQERFSHAAVHQYNEWEEVRGLHEPILNGGTYDVGISLFQNQYFRRAWVLQEVFNGEEVSVLYNNREYPWSLILRLNECITRSIVRSQPRPKDIMPPLFADLFTTASNEQLQRRSTDFRTYSRRSTQLDILDVILEGLDLEATNPRDKIFALLSFGVDMQDFNSPLLDSIRPDYTKSVARVYADFTRWCLETSKSLKALSGIHTSPGRTWLRTTYLKAEPVNEHPSWSLWHDGKNVWGRGTLGLEPGFDFLAAGESRVDTNLFGSCEDPMILRLRGWKIDTIEELKHYPFYSIYNRTLQDPRLTPDEQAMYNAYVHLLDPLSYRGTWTARFQRTGLRKDREPIDPGWEFSYHRDHHMAHSYGMPTHDNMFRPQQMNYVGCHDQQFFTTTKGLAGLCPPGTKPGDVVVVLHGGRIPFILRAQRAEDISDTEQPDTGLTQRFTLIGECFLKDFMHSQAVEHGSFAEQLFDLI